MLLRSFLVFAFAVNLSFAAIPAGSIAHLIKQIVRASDSSAATLSRSFADSVTPMFATMDGGSDGIVRLVNTLKDDARASLRAAGSGEQNISDEAIMNYLERRLMDNVTGLSQTDAKFFLESNPANLLDNVNQTTGSRYLRSIARYYAVARTIDSNSCSISGACNAANNRLVAESLTTQQREALENLKRGARTLRDDQGNLIKNKAIGELTVDDMKQLLAAKLNRVKGPQGRSGSLIQTKLGLDSDGARAFVDSLVSAMDNASVNNQMDVMQTIHVLSEVMDPRSAQYRGLSDDLMDMTQAVMDLNKVGSEAYSADLLFSGNNGTHRFISVLNEPADIQSVNGLIRTGTSNGATPDARRAFIRESLTEGVTPGSADDASAQNLRRNGFCGYF